MKIVLVRHAETPENKEGKLQGVHHQGFTEIGYRHLRDLKKKLDLYRFDIAFVSDLPRTLETATYILHCRKHLIVPEPLIREKSAGELTGQLAKNVNWEALAGSFTTRKPRGGESINDVRNRVKKFLIKLQKLDHQDVLVVSHGTFLKLLTGMILGLNSRDSIFGHSIDHCSISILKMSNREFSAVKVNSVSHLKN